MWPNGLKALRAIGPDVEEEVASRGCPITGSMMVMVEEPEPGAEPAPPAVPSAAMPMPPGLLLGIRWSEVQAGLASFVPPECIHLGRGDIDN